MSEEFIRDKPEIEKDNDGLRGELLRKGIHLAGLGYIPFYILTGRLATLTAVVLLTLVAIILEVLRRRSEIFPEWILRSYEKGGTGAHIYFGISILTVTLLFSPQASFVAIACGSAGDGVAGVVKRIRRDFAACSMFLSSLLVMFILSQIVEMSLPAAIVSAVIATGVESKLSRVGKYYVNDNLSVPLAAAVVYELGVMAGL